MTDKEIQTEIANLDFLLEHKKITFEEYKAKSKEIYQRRSVPQNVGFSQPNSTPIPPAYSGKRVKTDIGGFIKWGLIIFGVVMVIGAIVAAVVISTHS
jgi:hypothetical protein